MVSHRSSFSFAMRSPGGITLTSILQSLAIDGTESRPDKQERQLKAVRDPLLELPNMKLQRT